MRPSGVHFPVAASNTMDIGPRLAMIPNAVLVPLAMLNKGLMGDMVNGWLRRF